VRTKYLITDGFVSCSTRNFPANENETKQYLNRQVLRKLLDEISALREIISVLQSERIQNTRLLVHHEDDNSWCPVARGKSSRSKKVTQQFYISTSNRFNTLNEVADENEQRKALSCPKVNVEKKNKPMFYSDSYGRERYLHHSVKPMLMSQCLVKLGQALR
jgi:hypothetical protein